MHRLPLLLVIVGSGLFGGEDLVVAEGGLGDQEALVGAPAGSLPIELSFVDGSRCS
jgi:hypothetical protein